VLVEGVELAREFASRPELAALLGTQTEPAPGADLAAVLGHIRLDADDDAVSEAEFDALHH